MGWVENSVCVAYTKCLPAVAAPSRGCPPTPLKAADLRSVSANAPPPAPPPPTSAPPEPSTNAESPAARCAGSHAPYFATASRVRALSASTRGAAKPFTASRSSASLVTPAQCSASRVDSISTTTEATEP